MKRIVETVYDAEDIEKLHEMNDEEVATVLEGIKRGRLPQSYVIHGMEDVTYSEDDYYNSKLHIAINKAIMKLRNE